MKAGISPQLLVSQVKGTAAWLWDDPRAAGAARVLDAVDDAERAFRDGARDTAYFRLLLAAHFATVATFVPTDVDARIRHHAWWAMEEGEVVEQASGLVDEVASWDVGAVSARALASAEGSLSGHDGEWLGVRAGALGRAVALRAEALAARLAAAIDAELDREERVLVDALAGPAPRALAAATIVAHNLGDLSRVAEAWPKVDGLAPHRARYVRLGHPDAPAQRRPFVIAGALNKALCAHENHRFLPLRHARGLRRARALLLPIGPWLDAWGEAIARHEALDERDRAEVVAALLEHPQERPRAARLPARAHRPAPRQRAAASPSSQTTCPPGSARIRGAAAAWAREMRRGTGPLRRAPRAALRRRRGEAGRVAG